MNSTLKVRNFITKYATMSRVTIDRDWYLTLSNSGRALASRGKQVPELQPEATVRDKSGNFYNKFIVDGNVVLYRFNKSAGAKENPHIFLMDTALATSLHEPIDNAYEVIDDDFTV